MAWEPMEAPAECITQDISLPEVTSFWSGGADGGDVVGKGFGVGGGSAGAGEGGGEGWVGVGCREGCGNGGLPRSQG